MENKCLGKKIKISGKKNNENSSDNELNEKRAKDEDSKIINKKDKISSKIIDTSPINLVYFKDLVSDSYGKFNNNSFCVFESINGQLYLIYFSRNGSLISYNLNKFQKINEIKKAYNSSSVINFRHYLDKSNKRDLIISISIKDNSIKLWDIRDFQILLIFENINNYGFLFSACFLNIEEEIYIVTSNCNIVGNAEPIKVFDLNCNLVKTINSQEETIFYIDVYYDKAFSMNFIITGGFEYVKSYNYNVGEIYNKYTENCQMRYNSVIINDKGSEVKIIAPSVRGDIVIWNFHSGDLLKKIESNDIAIVDICHWNKDYFLTASNNNTIKIIDIEKEYNVKNLFIDNDCFETIKKINHPCYGECLLAHSTNYHKIKMWKIE